MLVSPYGSWRSPLDPGLVASASVDLLQVALDGDDVVWVEQRPTELGRNVLVRLGRDGTARDLLPAPWSARSRVHEYGGGAFAVARGELYFSSFADQRVYRDPAAPRPLTPEGPYRYADGVIDGVRRRLIAIREEHRDGREALNCVVSIRLDSGLSAGEPLASGRDFYSSPCLSPDGKRLAWLCWSHPNMPWDGTELWVGELEGDGSLERASRVAGGPEESIFQPSWSPDGLLHFISDRTGWWNLYRERDGRVEPLWTVEAELGVPQWVFGLSTYAFESPRRIVLAYRDRSRWRLATLDPQERRPVDIDLPYTQLSQIRASRGRAVFLGGSPSRASELVRLELDSLKLRVLRRSSELELDQRFLSEPELIEFPTEGGVSAFGLHYPPRNDDYAAPQGEKPPLLTLSHGGPTGSARSVLSPGTQYWTSRGFAVLDVDYGGSAGYGRAYRKRLEGLWGVVDVDDCVNGALFLARQGLADAARLGIRGGSAGGYTTLSALTFRNVFSAGASYYGVSDLEALAKDTHKFESRYLDRLVGPYPARADLYRERSPVHFPERISCPLILFQGLEDKVVPPDQAERMLEAALRKGLPVAYLAFEGEQHGFRKAETIRRTLEAELSFYGRIWGFQPPDVRPVEIRNLD